MTRYAALCAALVLSNPAAAQDPVEPAGSQAVGEPSPAVIDAQSAPTDFDLARKKVVDCEGEKFVFAWGAGARPTKVTMCSKKGATREEVVRMLEENAAKLEQATGMPDDRREAIVAQIRAKISEIRGSAATEGTPPPALAQPVATPAPQTAIAPPAARPVTPAPARPALAAAPRLDFECYTPGDIGSGGPCLDLARGTRLTVTARDALAGGTSLRFVRNGEERAEVVLSSLRKGQSAQMVLPRALCRGAVGGEARIEVVTAGGVVDSLGPYVLRC